MKHSYSGEDLSEGASSRTKRLDPGFCASFYEPQNTEYKETVYLVIPVKSFQISALVSTQIHNVH